MSLMFRKIDFYLSNAMDRVIIISIHGNPREQPHGNPRHSGLGWVGDNLIWNGVGWSKKKTYLLWIGVGMGWIFAH